MKDIPGTITDRLTILLPNYFEIGEVLSSSHRKDMVVEKRLRHRDMIGAEYRVAMLITNTEELEIAINHYNLLRKYKLV